ncbi:hypothetical protein [Nocardia miyunensis]|uniref:hypothetical protein n=1 Tax=Nocardia miyunensis TaxID=282684 RepID=UPI0012F4ADC6|nr:hypothetical protein [Nocardia miyunensis]
MRGAVRLVTTRSRRGHDAAAVIAVGSSEAALRSDFGHVEPIGVWPHWTHL